MKRYYAFAVLLVILLAAGFFAILPLTDKAKDKSGNDDVLILNEIAHKAAYESDFPENIAPGREFVILDTNGNIISDRRTDCSEALTVETAIQKRYPYAYIIANRQIAGSVILTDGEKRFEVLQKNILTGYCICCAVIMLAVFVFGAYIRKRIILPFENMRDFAADVAAGQLEKPLEMDKGNMFGVFSESFDIMREELKASKARELSLQKKERELVASLSHDLKTPVTGIKLTSELMAEVFAQNEGKELTVTADMIRKMENICKKSDEITNLVNDLFSTALEDLGEFKVNCTDENTSVIAEIVTKYDDKGLVRTSKPPEVLVNTDKIRLSQVIGNIISNSYKYAGTAIDIDYNVGESFLEMSIADHGCGVDNDETELITNKFYRGKNSTGKDGSGLGLYIVNILMEKMGGEMTVQNKDGLCVTLFIPLS